MDAELKAKWVAALRSGKYKQGREVLRSTDNKFCCLGVLREIVEPGAIYSGMPFGEGTSTLKNEHCAGMELNTMSDLADMNDSGKTFTEIADYIEANL